MIHSTARNAAAAFAWLALSVLSVVPVRADVVPFDTSETGRSAEGAFAATPGELIGNVQVVEYQGPYQASVGADPVDHAVRQAIGRSFYEVQPDDYDFLIAFADFPVDFGGFGGFHFQVANHVEGIGRPLHAGAPAYGSQGRLLGYIDMGERIRLPMLPNGHDYDALLDTLMHEIMHQWGVYVRYRDDEGQSNASLLGQHGSHWSFFADTDASVMYGARWQEQGANRFRAIGVRERYSPLDLYLAGFLPADQVPPIRLIRSLQGSPADLPRLGALVDGQPESISVERIVAEEGQRLPSYPQSRRDYRAALVLLVRPGQPPRPEMLGRLEMLRMQAQTRFAALTLGRGVLNVGRARPASGAEAGAPSAVGSDLPLRPDADLDLAGGWLLSRQFAGGHWQDKPATRTTDTALAAAALRSIGDAQADGAIASAAAWLRNARRTTVEEQAQLLRSRLLPTDDAALIAGALADGYLLDRGWGLNGGFEASTVDTAVAVDALFSHLALAPGGFPPEERANWRDAVPAQARGDCWTLHAGDGRCHLLASARALRALGAAGFVHADLEPAVERLFAWQRADHGFGEQGGSEAETAEALLALNAIGAPRDVRVLRAELYLAGRQRSDGSWQGSVATTAKVIEVLSFAARPDLRVRSAVVEAESTVQPGDRIGLRLGIDNGGAVAAPASRLHVAYVNEADAQVAGVIDAFATLPALLPLQREDLVGDWDTAGLPPGGYRIDIVLDADGEVDEVDESNNRAQLRVVLAAPPSQPDLDIAPGTAVLTPNVVVQVPTESTLTATLRNRGAVAASAVRVRASLLRGSQAIPLAETVLPELPPMSAVPVALALTIAHVDASEVLLEVDPDNTVPEANETNNSQRLRLYREATVDLAVFESDLTWTPENPSAGQDVRLTLVVRNRGTEVSPPTRIRIQASGGVTSQVPFDHLAQIPANASRSFTANWRPTAAGLHALRVDVDPDDLVPEIDEGNNTIVREIDVSVSTRPNLTLSSEDIVLVPDTPLQGGALSVGALVRNTASVHAAAFKVGFYLGDPENGGQRFAESIVAEGIPAGGERLVEATIDDLAVGGEIVIAVRADDGNEIDEVDEGDNQGIQVRMSRYLPDLVVREGDIRLEPAVPVPGAPNLLRVRVANVGQQPAEQFQVAVLIGRPESGGVPLAAPQPVAVLEPGASIDLDYTWVPPEQMDHAVVTVMVDPENSVRETSENNNRAELPFDLGDPNFFVTHPYFSPNGDGVKDTTRIVARFQSPETVVVRIVSEWDEEVKRYEGPELSGATLLQLDWDGLKDDGHRALDGEYRVRVERPDGRLVRATRIVLDTNRLPLLLAAGTDYEWATTPACNMDVVNVSNPVAQPTGSVGGGVVAKGRPFTDVRDGLFELHLDDRAPRLLVSPSELMIGGEQWNIHQWRTDIIESAVVILAEAPTGWPRRFRLFRRPLQGGGLSMLGPEQAWSGSRPELLGISGAGDIVLLEWDRVRRLEGPDHAAWSEFEIDYDLLDSARSDIHWGHDHFVARMSSHGDSNRHWVQVVLDGEVDARPIVDMGFDYDVSRLFDVDLVVDDAGGVAYHTSGYLPSGGQYIDAVDLHSGERWRLLDSTEPDGSNYTITRSPTDARLYVFDGTAGTLKLFDPSLESWLTVPLLGDFVWENLPAGSENRYYFDNFRWSDDGSHLLFDYVMMYPDPNGGELYWASQSATFLYRPSNANAAKLVISGDRKLVFPPFPSELQDTLFGGSSGFQIPMWLGGEPQFLLHDWHPSSGSIRLNGVTPLRGFRTGTLLGGRSGTLLHHSIAEQAALVRPNEGAVCPGGDHVAVRSLMNATARIALDYTGAFGSFGIKVIASDLYMDRYEVEYRRLEGGSSTWNGILSERRNVVDEVVSYWSPPSPGRYEVRLSIHDKAGNVVREQRAVSSFDESVLGTVRLTERFLSPNGDGVKETTSARFTVYRPTEVRIDVRNAQGVVVRTVTLSYPTPPEEIQEWVWDGRNDAGITVPDGDYQIVVAGRELLVTVDTVPPDAQFTWLSYLRAFRLSCASFDPDFPGHDPRYAARPVCSERPFYTPVVSHVVDDHLVEAFIEFAPSAGAQAWDVIGHLTPRVPGAIEVYSPRLLLPDHQDFAWRLSSFDAAGNSTVRPLSWTPELFLSGYVHYAASKGGASWEAQAKTWALDSFAPGNPMVPRHPDSAGGRLYRAGRETSLYPVDHDHVLMFVADTNPQTNQSFSIWVAPDQSDPNGIPIRCEGLPGWSWRQLDFTELAADALDSTLSGDTLTAARAGAAEGWRIIAVHSQHFDDRVPYVIQLVPTGRLPGQGCDVLSLRFSAAEQLFLRTGTIPDSYVSGVNSLRGFVETLRLDNGSDVAIDLAAVASFANWNVVNASARWTLQACDGGELQTYETFDATSYSIQGADVLFDVRSVDYARLPYGVRSGGPPAYALNLTLRNRWTGQFAQYEWGQQGTSCVQRPNPPPVCELMGSTRLIMSDWVLGNPGSFVHRIRAFPEGTAVPVVLSGQPSGPGKFTVDISSLEAGKHRMQVDRQTANGSWAHVVDHDILVDREPPVIVSSDPEPQVVRLCRIGRPGESNCRATPANATASVNAVISENEYLRSARLMYQPAGVGPLRRLSGDNIFDRLSPTHYLWEGRKNYSAQACERDGLGSGSASIHVTAMDCELESEPMPVGITLQIDDGVDVSDPMINDVGQLDFYDSHPVDQSGTTSHVSIPRVAVSASADVPVRFSFTLDESALVHAVIVPFARTESSWNPDGDPVRTIHDDLLPAGRTEFIWDGRDSDGQLLPDRAYALQLTVLDDCEHQSIVYFPLRVDESGPTIDSVVPQSGTVLAPIEPIEARVWDGSRGTMDIEWRKDIPGEAWQVIAIGLPVSERIEPSSARHLTTWRTVDVEPGVHLLRIRATDTLGHVSEVVSTVEIPATVPLLLDAGVSPAVFSPNGDDTLDSATIGIQLAMPAHATVSVVHPGGDTVRVLADQQLVQNRPTWIWDGKDESGSDAPDGRYDVHILVRSEQDPDLVQSVRLAVTVDRVGPVLSLVSPDGVFSQGAGPLQVAIGDLHPKSYQIQLQPTGGLGPWSGTQFGVVSLGALQALAEGEYRLDVQAVDLVENTSAAQFEFVIDRTPPVAELLTPAADSHAGTVGGPVAITGHATDAHFARYRLELRPEDGGAAIVLAQSETAPAGEHLFDWLPNQPDGRYLLTLVVADKAGWESVAQVPVVVDNTPPMVAIDQPGDDSFIVPPVRVEGTAADANLRAYRIELAAAGAGTAHWSLLHEGTESVQDDLLAELAALPPEGRFRLRVSALDRAGNRAEQVVTVDIDTVPPATPLQLTADRLGNDGARLNWRPVDAPDLAGYRLYRDGVSLAEVVAGTTRHDDLVVPDGERVYTVTALDHAGNESAPSNPARLRIDSTPPETRLLRPVEGERVRGDVEIWGTAHSDDDFARFRISATPAGGDAIELAQGTVPLRNERLTTWDTRALNEEILVRIELHAEDTSGNAASVGVEVLVDNQPPAAPVGLTAVVENTLDVRLDWQPNVEADLVGYLVYRGGLLLNGDPLSDPREIAVAEVTWLDEGVADGQHDYRVVAVDLAGNVSEPSDPANVGFEGQPPSVEFERPAEGHAFEHSVLVRVRSEHQDIVQVLFEQRAVAGGDWTAIGAPVATLPYQITFTPGALPYGDYDLRATATDSENLTDPAPPVRRVRYRDLTAPDAFAGLAALVDGGDVQLSWQPVAADDLAGYRIARRAIGGGDSEVVADVAAPDTAYLDADRDDDRYEYTVFAFDASDNLSAGRTVTARVHTPRAGYPYTPTEQAETTVCGTADVPGQVQVEREVDGDAQPLPSGSTDAEGAFCVESIALLPGTNHLRLRVLDADGHRSKPAGLVLRHGLPPAVPEGLSVAVDGHEATLTWQANAEPDIVGYRVFRNGNAVQSDVDTAETGIGYYGYGNDANGYPANELFDGDPDTFGLFYLDSGEEIWVEQTYADPMLLAGIDIDLRAEPGNPWQPVLAKLYGWSGEAWIKLDEKPAAQPGPVLLRPARPYRSDRLRLTLSADDRGAIVRLHDIRVVERPLHVETQRIETLPDGAHAYRVSAVNAFGFESERSEPVEARVGDWQPPEPVVLSADVVGADAHLSWTQSASEDIDAYLLMRDDTLLADVPAGDPRRHDDLGLANGTYRYHVLVRDLTGHLSEPSNDVEVVIDQAIDVAAPTGLAVGVVEGGGALDLAWQPGAGDTPAGYRVFRSDVAGGPHQPIADVAVTTHRDSGLVNGRRYHYVVRALDARGNLSATSNEASGVPYVSPAPTATRLLHPGLGGGTVELAGNATVVSGWAEPGAQVTVLRDGQPLATAQAVVWRDDDILPEYAWFIVSPDGRHLLRLTQDDRVELLRRGEDAVVADFPWCAAVDWLDAETLLLCEDDSTGKRLVRHSIVSQQRVTLMQADSFHAASLSPDRGTALVGAYRQVGGQWANGIWLVDLADGTWTQVDTSALTDPYLSIATWSHDGSRFAFATYDGQLALGDVGTAQIQVPDIVADGDAFFLRDAPAVLVGGDIGAGFGIHRIDLATLDIERLPLEAGAQTRVGLSADGSRFLYLLDDAELVVRHWPSLALVERRPLVADDVWPAWLANGEVQLSHWIGHRVVAPAGLFLTDSVQLPVGLNRLSAYAQRPGGGSGGVSEPVNVIVPSPHRPDLAILQGDLRVLPAVTPVGEGAQLLARVRNVGAAPAPSSQLRIVVNAPNGQLVHAAERDVPALAAGAFAEITVAVPATAEPGEYRLTGIVDPANLVAETNEGNNQSVVVLLAARDDQPELALDLSHSSLAPGGRLTGAAAAIAVATPFHGRLAVRVLDAQGYLVADLGDIAVQLSGPAQRAELPIDWSAAQVFAGQYRVQARLRALSGALVREAERLVTVRSEAHVALGVSPDQAEVPSGGALTGDIGIDYLAGNRLLVDVALHLRLLDESGNERATQQHALGSLLPGESVVRGYGFAGAGLAPGLYQVVAELRDTTLLTQAAAGVRVLPAGGGAGLVGTLALPTHAVPLGDALTIGYAVENRSGDDLLALPLHIQLRPADLGAPVAQASVQIDLPAGQTWQGSLPVPASALRQGQYLVTLDRTDTAPAQRLALGSFGTLDATPPAVAIHAPADGAMTTGAFDVDVRAMDSHSAVAAVRLRVNDGPWLGLGQGIQAPGQHLRHLSGLADGAVTLQAMAEDAAGNQALSEPVAVVVDATAPLIVIDGVEHGAVYNHAVAPTIAISDAHLTDSHVVLDGQVFASGASVADEGVHRLFVTAVDAAGNRSNAEVAFDIDLTPPSVVFTHPADGATVGSAQVDVLGVTEALAEVRLTLDGQSLQTVAAADGRFAFDGVPLAIGENLLSAQAVDRAGNVGAPSTLTVHRIEGGAGTVEGTLTLDAATVAHGQPIAGSRVLSLDGGVPLNGLPVRLRLLRGADGTDVAVQSGTVDLVPGTPDAAPFAFDTAALPAQGYRLSLEAELDDGGGVPAWVQLDQAKVAVVDVDAPSVQLLQPAPGAVVGSPFALLATALDALSGLDAVEAQLDDGPWTPLAALADPADGFGGDLAGDDGVHVVRVRATDGAGNVGHSADHAIAIDTLPPVIAVTGVKDGALLNQPVVPVIDVTDAHLDVVDILLDGQPFASGTQVDGEGAHVLTVHAVDTLGQSASASVAFTLDFSAPDTAILDPADGAQVTAPQVAVLVHSEPHVALHVQAGAHQAQLTADADGLATFAAVPLALGDNTIVAWAVDGAGNVGASAGITVRRVQPGDAKLAGRLDDLPAVVAPDDPVAGTWHIANTGDADSGPMQVRLRLRAGGVTLAEELWMRDIAVGQTDSAPFLFAAAGWPAGALAVELHARPQSAAPLPWLLLAAEVVPVDDGQTPHLHWLQPEPGSTVPERFTVAVRLTGAPAAPGLVELRVDDGDWQPMAAGTEAGTYELALRIRQEWWHRFHVRAWSAADLLAELEHVRLCVDLGRLFAHDFERHDRLFRNGFDPGPCPSPLPDEAAEPEPPPPPDTKRFAADMIDARRVLALDVLKRLAQGGV